MKRLTLTNCWTNENCMQKRSDEIIEIEGVRNLIKFLFEARAFEHAKHIHGAKHTQVCAAR